MSSLVASIYALLHHPYIVPAACLLVIIWSFTEHYLFKQTNTKPSPKRMSEQSTLAPPKDDPITVEELALHDGSDTTKPIWVAIKGTVFDVSPKRETYQPGAGYSVFAGKDASKALGKSSLKPEDCVADYSSLDEKELKVLDDWYDFFSKRYNIVGRIVQ